MNDLLMRAIANRVGGLQGGQPEITGGPAMPNRPDFLGPTNNFQTGPVAPRLPAPPTRGGPGMVGRDGSVQDPRSLWGILQRGSNNYMGGSPRAPGAGRPSQPGITPGISNAISRRIGM